MTNISWYFSQIYGVKTLSARNDSLEDDLARNIYMKHGWLIGIPRSWIIIIPNIPQYLG